MCRQIHSNVARHCFYSAIPRHLPKTVKSSESHAQSKRAEAKNESDARPSAAPRNSPSSPRVERLLCLCLTPEYPLAHHPVRIAVAIDDHHRHEPLAIQPTDNSHPIQLEIPIACPLIRSDPPHLFPPIPLKPDLLAL